jgi:outer membrane protein OmpA-like peptidoglycan-associated protein
MTDSLASAPPAPEAPTPPDQPATPRRWLRRLLWSLGGLLALLALLVGLLTWWLPEWSRPRIEAAATEALGTPVSLARIEFTPWQLDLRLHGLRVGPKDAPLAELDSATLQLSAETFWRRAPVVQRLQLSKPSLWLHRETAERHNFSALLEHLRERQAQQPASPPDAAPARFALHNIELLDGRIHLQDDVLAQHHEIEALQIGLPFISNLPSDVAIVVQPRLAAQLDGSALQLTAQAKPFAPGQPAQLQLDWHDLALQPWLGLLKPVLPPELAPQLSSGTLDLALSVDFEAAQTPRLLIKGELALRQLDLALPGLGAQARWNALHLRGLTLAPLAQDYRIAEVEIDQLDASYTRRAASSQAPGQTATAKPTPPHANAPASASAASNASGTAASGAASASSGSDSKTAAAPPLQWLIETVRCRNCRVRVHDASVQPATHIELQDTQLELHNVASDATQPISWTLGAKLASAVGEQAVTAPGTLQLQGQVRRTPLALQATVQLGAIDLAVLQPYIAPQLNLVLVAGQLGTQGQLTLEQPAATAPLALHYRGKLTLDQLRTRDGLTSDEFVRWQQLGFEGLEIGWRGGMLDANLGRVSLDGLDARVILHPDGHLNLADVSKHGAEQPPTSLTTPQTAASGAARAPQPPAATTTATTTASASAPGAAASAPNVRWQSIGIRRSEVRFSDSFIRPNYSARLTQLQGTVSALNAASPAPARITLAGTLDDSAPLRINGRVHPLGPKIDTDIEVSARGIALTRLSAYAERYAGYGIETGSLSATLHYKIEQGRLEADHQLFIDQLTFGEAVQNSTATQLPVRLAVSLLKNRRGEIELHLPVSGTLDDPSFSVGGIVWQMVVNLVSKAVTAPFALLFGDGREDAGQIDFAAGSAELSPAGRARLDELATKLADRPGVKLEVTGQADADKDADALQRARAAAAQAAAQAASGAAAKQRPPTPGASKIAGAATGSAGSAPAAAASAVAAAASAPVVSLADLQTLADDRATRVMAHLASQLPAERILLNRATVKRPDADASATRVQLSLH